MRKKTHEGLPGGQNTMHSQIQQANSSFLSLHTFSQRGARGVGRREGDRSRGRHRERASWERASASALPGRACGRTLGEVRTLCGSHPRSLHLTSHTPLTPGAPPVLAIISELWREEFLCATRHLNASQFPHSMNPLEKQESALTVEDGLLLDNWRDAHRSVLTTWGFSLCSHCGVKGNTSPLDEARPWGGGGEWSAFHKTTATEAPQATETPPLGASGP